MKDPAKAEQSSSYWRFKMWSHLGLQSRYGFGKLTPFLFHRESIKHSSLSMAWCDQPALGVSKGLWMMS